MKWLKQITLHFQADKEDRFISFSDIEDLRHGRSAISGSFIRYLCMLTIVTGTIMTAVVQPRKWTTAGELILNLVAVLFLLALSLVGTRLMISWLTRLAAKIDEKEL